MFLSDYLDSFRHGILGVVQYLRHLLIVTGLLFTFSQMALAASFTVLNGQTVSTQTLNNNETGTIDAGGTISTSSNLAFGVIAAFGTNVTITNNGLITTTGDQGEGIYVIDNSTVTNNGTISTTGTISAWGIDLGGDNILITNTGTITTTGNNGEGIYVSFGTSGNTIINSGLISTTGTDAEGIHVSGSNNSINNSGTISVTNTDSEVIRFFSLANSLTNSGTISATGNATIAIFGGTGAETINLQSGSQIIGDILLNGGNDILNINGNTTITGNVNLGSGTDSFNLNSGILVFNGTSTNATTTTINTGATLSGNATTGTLTLNGGTLAPGNSIGTINITGNVDFSGGGVYQVEVNAAGQSDLINATGTATLTGGSVQVVPEAGTYNLSTDYTILTATGGLIGPFDSVASSLAFLTPTLSYDANNVYLNLMRNSVSFSSVATTPNQLAVSNLLSLLSTNPTEVQDIISQLLILTTSGAQQAFDSLSGVQHTNAPQLMHMQHQQFMQLLFNRTGLNLEQQFAFNPVQDLLLAYQATGMNAGDNLTPQRGWWLQGLGRFGEFDDTSNATGADYHTAGVAFGIDTEWRDWVIGIAGGFSNTDADTFGGDLEVDSFHGAVYAGREFSDGIYLNVAAGFGYHDTEADRTVTVGTLSVQASADYDALTAGVGVEVGKAFELSPSATLTPYVGIEYTNTDRDDFTESGAGAMNLSVEDEDHDSLRTTLGIRVSEEITTGTSWRIKPYAYAAYVREHLDTEVTMEAGFTGTPTSTFRIDGTDLDRDRAQVGIGINGQVNDRMSFNVGYNGEIADSDDHHGVSATIDYTW